MFQQTFNMKTYISILVIAMSAIAWGCSSKHEKTAEEIAATEDSRRIAEKDAAAAQFAERRAKLKETRESKAEQRRMAMEEKAKTSPTYKDKNGNVVYY